MKNKILIAEVKDTDFDPKHQMRNVEKYEIRRCSRGVLVNGDKVALLNVSKHKYHKLPGGGVDGNESIEEAFKRQLIEEVGCDCEIIDQGGIILEWRDGFKLLQINYVFLAKVVGQVGQNKLEQDEIDDGFEVEWVPMSEAEQILKNDNPANYEGKFIQIRGRAIVEFYNHRLNNKDKLSG